MARSGAGGICGPLQAHALSHPGGKIAHMVSHSTPGNSSGPCWHCINFDGLAYQGSVAVCKVPSGPRVRSSPATGCTMFVREVGSDDEPGPPGGMVMFLPVAARRPAPTAQQVTTPTFDPAP